MQGSVRQGMSVGQGAALGCAITTCVGSRLTAATDICQLFVSWYLYCLDLQTNHTLDMNILFLHGLLGNVRPVVSPADGH
jgi:hypothetical protein